MRFLLAGLMIGLLVLPAAARGRKPPAEPQMGAAERQKKARAEESAYKDALKRIPNQKPADPWSKVR